MAVPTVRSMARQEAGSTGVNACPSVAGAVPRSPVFDRNDLWLRQLAVSLTVDAGTLAEFRALMLRQDFIVEMSRFFLDLAYAYRQLAIAHSLGHPSLRILSLELFEACQRLDYRRRQLAASSAAHFTCR
ncbi:MAG: hypothetical protein OEM00_00215 [Burkholderiaceae bacterium]|nr:hypothetical protein [Burkholderiaceae bacterium]MDH3459409.1 hypothetical protein [Burkholderiaceae bacterium]